MFSKGDRVTLNGRLGTIKRTGVFLASGVVVKWDDTLSSSAFFGEDIKKLQLVM
jgi:glucokinase